MQRLGLGGWGCWCRSPLPKTAGAQGARCHREWDGRLNVRNFFYPSGINKLCRRSVSGVGTRPAITIFIIIIRYLRYISIAQLKLNTRHIVTFYAALPASILYIYFSSGRWPPLHHRRRGTGTITVNLVGGNTKFKRRKR